MTTSTVAERVLFQSDRFNPAAKVVNMMTNPAFSDDVAHAIVYGFTLGSIMHHRRRNANWNELSANAYNQACNNPKLRAFRSADGNQVAVLGYSYMSIFQYGEYQKKVVSYNCIDKVSVAGNEVRLWVRNTDSNYSYVALNNMVEGAQQLIKCLKYYMKKSGQK